MITITTANPTTDTTDSTDIPNATMHRVYGQNQRFPKTKNFRPLLDNAKKQQIEIENQRNLFSR